MEGQRVAVVREAHEVKIAAAMGMLRKVYNSRKAKQQQLQAERQKVHKRQVEKVEARRLQKSKEACGEWKLICNKFHGQNSTCKPSVRKKKVLLKSEAKIRIHTDTFR